MNGGVLYMVTGIVFTLAVLAIWFLSRSPSGGVLLLIGIALLSAVMTWAWKVR